MSEEQSVAEIEAEKGKRFVMVRIPCSTNTLHQPGDIIEWTGPIPENKIVRELTPDEIEDHDYGLVRNAGPGDGFEQLEEQRETVREEVLRQAISQIDAGDSASWHQSGRPTIGAVNRELMKIGARPETTSKAELQAKVPDLRRPARIPGSDLPVSAAVASSKDAAP